MKIDATVHGFHSGFRDWAAECTGFAHEVAETALAHTIENKVELATGTAIRWTSGGGVAGSVLR